MPSPLSSYFALKPYCVRCASSAMTITFLRSVRAAMVVSFCSGSNFCIVVNTIPPDSTDNNDFNSLRVSACFGVCLNNPLPERPFDLTNVLYSWLSKSLRSVTTTNVGLLSI